MKLPVGLSIAIGVALGAAPFLRYAPWGHALPHADHAPHHGGELVMIGDDHLELVVSDDRVELWTSDALRRPLVPRAGSVAFDGGAAQPLRWDAHRLTAPTMHGAREATTSIDLADGTRLSHRFALRAR